MVYLVAWKFVHVHAAGLSEERASLNLLPAGGFSLHDVY
eukprot:COSAG06_NODE_41557_length_390_cov_0.701031_1_plen_38_part_01